MAARILSRLPARISGQRTNAASEAVRQDETPKGAEFPGLLHSLPMGEHDQILAAPSPITKLRDRLRMAQRGKMGSTGAAARARRNVGMGIQLDGVLSAVLQSDDHGISSLPHSLGLRSEPDGLSEGSAAP